MNWDNRALGSLGLDTGALGLWRPSSANNSSHLYRTEMFGQVRTNVDTEDLDSLGLDSSTLSSGVWRRPYLSANSNASLRAILNEVHNDSSAYYDTPQHNSTFYSQSELSSSPESCITYDIANNRLPRKITKRSDSSESSYELSAMPSSSKIVARPTSENNLSTYNVWENSRASPPESDLNELQLRVHEILNLDSNKHSSADRQLESSNSDHEDPSNSFCQLLQQHYFPESNPLDVSSPSMELVSNVAKIRHGWNDRPAQNSNNSSYAEQFMRNENLSLSDQSANDLFYTPDTRNSTPQKSCSSSSCCCESIFQIAKPSTTVPQRSATKYDVWKDCAAQNSTQPSYALEKFMRNEMPPCRDQSVNNPFNTPDIHHSTPQKSFYTPASCRENMFQIADSSHAPTDMSQRSLTFQKLQYSTKYQPSTDVQDKSTLLPENLNRKGLKRMVSADWCNFCMKNGESIQVYSKHSLKERRGKKLVVTCPILRSFVCSTCKATGDNAHTETYCPVLMSRNNGQRFQSTTVTVKSTRTKSNGQRRY